MPAFLRLAIASAWNRRATLALVVLAVALSVVLVLGVERARVATKASFAASVSGTDLIVGPRTSPLQLVLYAVFRLGNATADMRWSSYQAVAADPGVAWSVPLVLGDSHRGFPVLGTTPEYFERFRHGRGVALSFSAGKPFEGIFDAVIGAEVAERLGLAPGAKIALTHGMNLAEGPSHDDKPFTVTGILARTGTPVDRTVHVGLAGIEAIHLGWQGGMPPPGFSIPAQFVTKFDLTPKRVTAALVGLKSRGAVFEAQRRIQAHADEPLLAVLPGVALDELWQTLDLVERVLAALAVLVLVVSLAGLVAVLLAGLGERRRELAVLRSVGAGTGTIAGLIAAEMVVVTVVGALLGVVLLTVAAAFVAPVAATRLGLSVLPVVPSPREWLLLAAVVGAAVLASVIPAVRALRLALADGLTPRL
jgi:putative ABC transport system permease protein